MTKTFRSHPGQHVFVGVLSAALAALLLGFPVEGLFTPGFYKGYSAGQIAGVLLFGCGLGLVFAWLGIRQFRNGIQVSDQKLTIRNELRTYTVAAADIRAITLQPKSVGEGGTRWVPRVELTAGKKMWIDNLECGPASKPPEPGRAAVVAEIRALLGLGDADLTAETG